MYSLQLVQGIVHGMLADVVAAYWLVKASLE